MPADTGREEVPDFRVVITTLCLIHSGEHRSGESLEQARWELVLEAQGLLEAKLAELNAEYGLQFGVIDVNTREIAGVSSHFREVAREDDPHR